MTRPANVRILVCGDAGRGDDGAPLVAIGRLLPTLPRATLDQVEVRRREQLQVDDLADLPPGTACVIVDAAAGVEAGGIVTVPLGDLAADGAPLPRSAHGGPIGSSLKELAALRGAIPPGSFVGIGGRSFGFGVPMSIPVRQALPGFATAIELEINRLLGATATRLS